MEKPLPFMLSNVFCIQSWQMQMLFGMRIIFPAICSGRDTADVSYLHPDSGSGHLEAERLHYLSGA